jgi:hypothetical protein
VPDGPVVASSTAAKTTPLVAASCRRRNLVARFAGGGLGTGNDFGEIVIRNAGPSACRIAGAVTFTAFLPNRSVDRNAVPNRPLPRVDVVLPAKMAPYRDGKEYAGYLAAEVMGPERDDPTQPTGLCREQDKLAPAVLRLTIGRLTFTVTNSDARSVQVTQVYGCHGRVLLENVQLAS